MAPRGVCSLAERTHLCRQSKGRNCGSFLFIFLPSRPLKDHSFSRIIFERIDVFLRQRYSRGKRHFDKKRVPKDRVRIPHLLFLSPARRKDRSALTGHGRKKEPVVFDNTLLSSIVILTDTICLSPLRKFFRHCEQKSAARMFTFGRRVSCSLDTGSCLTKRNAPYTIRLKRRTIYRASGGDDRTRICDLLHVKQAL